ncbi:MAG: hypothetical protein LBR17_07930 [Bacteroidales bacterium]|jgi:hypothetical protein|nr:hypothetical protein [Bacteroidales bacterium]
MKKTEFVNAILKIKKAKSIRGIVYSYRRIDGNDLIFVREGKTKEEKIDLDELFEFYKSNEEYTNKNARKYMSLIVLSPSAAILNKLSNETID